MTGSARARAGIAVLPVRTHAVTVAGAVAANGSGSPTSAVDTVA